MQADDLLPWLLWHPHRRWSPRLAFAWLLLSPRPAAFVGGLALILVVVAGSSFLFLLATLVSLALEGEHRRQFQIAVSLAVPHSL